MATTLPLDPELYWTHCSEDFDLVYFGHFWFVRIGGKALQEAASLLSAQLFLVRQKLHVNTNNCPAVIQQSSTNRPKFINNLSTVVLLFSLTIID